MSTWINPKDPRNNNLFRTPTNAWKGVVPALAGDNNGGFRTLPQTGNPDMAMLASLLAQLQGKGGGGGGGGNGGANFGFERRVTPRDRAEMGNEINLMSGVTDKMVGGGMMTDQKTGKPENIFDPSTSGVFKPGNNAWGYGSKGFWQQPPGSKNNFWNSPFQPQGMALPDGRRQGWTSDQLAANAAQQRQQLVNGGLSKIPGIV